MMGTPTPNREQIRALEGGGVTDREAAVAELIAWWKAEGVAPAEAMRALGYRPPLDCGWDDVLPVAAAEWDRIALEAAERHAARLRAALNAREAA